MTTTLYDLTDTRTRMAARKWVAGSKTRIREEFAELNRLAHSLDPATSAVALDDLGDLLVELAATLHSTEYEAAA